MKRRKIKKDFTYEETYDEVKEEDTNDRFDEEVSTDNIKFSIKPKIEVTKYGKVRVTHSDGMTELIEKSDPRHDELYKLVKGD